MKSAIISPCGMYRYTLHRRIPSALRWINPVLFIMLNPSIADATIDDPTIRRCLGFAKDWARTDLTVVNLFALRATNPKELLVNKNPIGPDNDMHIAEQIEKHSKIGFIVAAWGSHAIAKDRVKQLGGLLKERIFCLGMNKDGNPKHPLYLKKNSQLIPWEMK